MPGYISKRGLVYSAEEVAKIVSQDGYTYDHPGEEPDIAKIIEDKESRDRDPLGSDRFKGPRGDTW